MQTYVWWVIVGVALVGIELVSGTLYLLFLGVAAFAAAASAYAGGGFALQVVVAALVAVLASLWVQHHRKTRVQPAMPALDIGQPVNFEAWLDEQRVESGGARRARVRYRGAIWEARVAGAWAGTTMNATAPGEVLYIEAIDGNTLTVSKSAHR